MDTESGSARRSFDSTEEDAELASPRYADHAGGSNLPPLGRAGQVPREPDAVVSSALREPAAPATLMEDTSFGPILRPQNPSLWDYKCALSEGDGTTSIRFAPEKFLLFDRIVVIESGTDASGRSNQPAFATRHARYLHYAPLRRNIAILRNHLMLQYSPAGQAGEINRSLLKSLATRLGKALHVNDREPGFLERLLHILREAIAGKKMPPRGYNHFLELANVPDRGIALMYEYLRRMQLDASFPGTLPSTAQLPKNWILPPLEQSPFSSENMRLHSDASHMARVADALEIVAAQMRSVDQMHERDKEISVEHARDILRNMRIIATGKEGEKTVDEIDGRTRDAQGMLEAALCFQGGLAALAKSNPGILNDPSLLAASDAVRKLVPRVRNEQKIMAHEEHHDEHTHADPLAMNQPRVSPNRQIRTNQQRAREPIGMLIHRIEDGIHRIEEMRKTAVAAGKQSPSVSQAIGEHQVLQDGLSTMSSPKIHQVSVHDQDLIQTIRKANEQPEQEKQKQNTGGQNGPGRG